MSENIVIVGAGVIGLTIAYQLVTENGYDATSVNIIASDFPSTGSDCPEYTSSKSGAHFRPFPSKSPQELRDSKLARPTYKFFKKLAVTNPESSVKWIQGFDYLENNDTLYETTAAGYTEDIDNFKIIEKSQLPRGIEFGASYDTWAMNSPKYLEFLENTLSMKYGVNFVREKVESLKQVCQLYPGALLFNCTGRGLQFNGGFDPNSYSIRGQTLLVRAPLGCQYLNKTITYQLANGSWIFVIPRPLNGGIILGGTKQIGNLNSNPSQNDTEHLIKLGEAYFPDLMIEGKFDIRRVNVGFRPARNGGTRISSYKEDGVQVIDCYGFGGSGMEMSWGAAMRAIGLIDHGFKL
ncbi:hypothetical protein PSN45_003652 [Yamadazyma tenuis]|uniref:Nucleotide-binding domain-containing protein n=1 Tax=Candida tenuis (strain ATCC 10573 / BCRC 21748 / CBS 615 / JCM 9827 / NBRC 10315 / NRRL Y-1498 / VKM Y-70) TaxID=590646 RepID=G3B768_CANTC|nr:uncharacterized protein CANTEDRAFT_123862 [Yamadazyma tenuis ATCC 10573]XP_006687510.1 nucleotide-binding domain-containing protein [Yamadazyma tenuis ATCC 10573]WEJ96107.1 hypothetical protein PSN45_003643 [Yamadazyma tenuis]EGV62965.1 hypothetical protein CANTEDRAFT_123862 [Yamadazyma tenuis ATCC 10573]EGV62966.1 nucleotide-binding domain-containing protein [Yamadazyma tenuis ATCC 10573]WEJ96116.1 hypothetical protein PSN45_003652 [Yamadazyma tenuis]